MNRRRSAGLLLVLVSIAVAPVACVPQPVGRATASPGSATPPTATRPPIATPSGPTPSPSFRRPTPTPLPTFFAYLVRTGDTLTSIARKFETTPASLAYWNRVAYPSLDPDSPNYRPNDIRVGWTLVLIPNAEVDPENLPGEPTDEPEEPVEESEDPDETEE